MGTLKNPTLKNLHADFGTIPKKQNSLLQTLGEPHVNSFNEFVNFGLDQIVSNLHPVEFNMPNNGKIKLNFVNLQLHNPTVPYGHVGVTDVRIFPKECRQRASTYKGKLIGRVQWWIDDEHQKSIDKDLGEIPIMIKSNRCNLENLKPVELVFHGEHEQEWGGYFIVNGNERLVRMLLCTRRNYPICIKRAVWKDRGKQFSDLGIYLRCVKEDQTSTLNVLHYVTDGSARIMFSHQKLLYYVPLALTLKCLCDYSDFKIYQYLVRGFEDNLYYIDAVKGMLTAIHEENLDTQEDCKNYLGKLFRVRFVECPEWWSDSEVADFVLKECVLIHLNNDVDKFNQLVFMTQKLFTFVQDQCKVEGADSVMMQEVLLGGHLYQQVVKDKLQTWLTYMKYNILKKLERDPSFKLTQSDFVNAVMHTSSIDTGIQQFLSTGNISSKSGLGLMQDKGLTILAENINRMRYMSHFRSVHRGSFFQEMRTTEARQLLPDAWGFICPVHTPDGTPCGLLNHLTSNCIITQIAEPEKIDNVPKNLIEFGMVPLSSSKDLNFKQYYCVQLDGRIIGYISDKIINIVVHQLRVLKVKGAVIPKTTEIALIPKSKVCSQYPGLFLFVGPARMMRPLKNLLINEIEYVGTLEQVYLDVAVCPEESYKGVSTHMELSKTSFLSNLAQLIPMPDMNQSPRNMYQCQMGKQTMGTPCHNFPLQAETKLYRIQTPGSPLFRPIHYDDMNLDDFAMGTNAIVAVVSYTGYDMEDAMIINKASQERGFAHGSLLKSEFIELEEPASYFCRDPTNPKLDDYLEADGLPFIGRTLKFGEPMYCFYHADHSKYVTVKCKNKEEYYVDRVNRCGDFNEKKGRTACLIFRVPRNPSVGDKFASRAGQKGICSQLWPAEDLPFTETGLVPDIIFNPHGFPSRMTIAMMVEIMAGKSAALHGLVHDATPFKFTEDDTAIDYFGKLLEAGGYDYYGTETLYSGIDGREMPARIFFGIVHYQRLRHMVSDKWQVRTTGPTDMLTRQPVHGRSKGGGIRFGEMERDALISHGMSFYLQDRLLHCSDKTVSYMCSACVTLIGPVTEFIRVSDKRHLEEKKETCRLCGTSKNVDLVEIPYIFKFFVTQLASSNIKLKIGANKV